MYIFHCNYVHILLCVDSPNQKQISDLNSRDEPQLLLRPETIAKRPILPPQVPI